MSPADNLIPEGGEGKEPTQPEKSKPAEEERKEPKIIRSYNVTYEQIKQQEMGGASKGASGADSAEAAAPEEKQKKSASSRFGRLTAQFRKINVQESLDQFRGQQRGIFGLLWTWAQKNKFISMLILVLAGLLVIWGLSRIFFGGMKKKTAETSGISVVDMGTQVKVLKVTKTDFADSILAMGNIRGFAQVNLGFQVAGVVSSFAFREGDEIKAGQVISQLDPQEQMLKYEQAKVNYENAKGLYDLGAIIALKLQEAKINLDLAQTELAKTAVVAPTDGILGSREVEVGSSVNPNMKIATFLDINDVFAEVGIMEREINKVVLGQAVKVNVDAYPDLDFGGTVTNIEPMVKGKSKTLNVKVQIANPYRLLLPGMFVRIRIKIFEAKNAIIIPRPALKKVKGAYHVFTVNSNNKAEFKTVQLGYVTTDNVQVTEGLSEGDLAVVEGMEELKDGATVQVMEYQTSQF